MTTEHLDRHSENQLEKDLDQHLEIKTSNYVSRFDKIADNLLYLKREHHYPKGFETVDTFGDFSILAFATLKEGSVTVSQGSQSISLKGPVALFVPKYSVVKWSIHTPVLYWSAFITNQPLNDNLNSVSIFKHSDFNPHSIHELKNFMTHSELKFSFQNPEHNHLPKMIKDYLDQNQFDTMEISQLGLKFNLTPSQVTKIFKKYYGITPVEYRSKVRVFNSMFNLLNSNEKMDITKIAFESGFSDLSRFNKQFKKITSTTPSKFKFKDKD